MIQSEALDNAKIRRSLRELRARITAVPDRPRRFRAALARWAGAWRDPGYSGWRIVHQLSGSDELVRDAVKALAGSCEAESLEQVVQEQLGDEAVTVSEGRRIAIPLEVAGIFLGGGAFLESWGTFLQALAAGCGIAARTSTGREAWPLAFSASLAAIDPEVAACVEIYSWPSEALDLHRALAEECDRVLAHGSDGTMNAIQSITPANTPFLPFGSRLSAALVTRGADLARAAGQAAVDLAIYDQGGCLSPRMFLVEGDDARARGFARTLNSALAALPPASLRVERSAELQATIRTARELASFTEDALVLGPADLAWSVIYSPTDESEIEPSPTGRVATIYAFGSLQAGLEKLRPFQRWLQCAGIGAGSDLEFHRAAAPLADLGFTRICPLGKMQQPGIGWSHDGRPMLSEFVRFVDLECGV